MARTMSFPVMVECTLSKPDWKRHLVQFSRPPFPDDGPDATKRPICNPRYGDLVRCHDCFGGSPARVVTIIAQRPVLAVLRRAL
jgi:hypothetical protein